MERALVVVYHWNSKGLLHQVWEEEDAGAKAFKWMQGLEEDYPQAAGWAHVLHMNEEARKRFNEIMEDPSRQGPLRR